ncbi:hypothetical protein PanWU01x14_005680 [Parasponia andersonii]|uniref:Uncharacterized protein n=1 Tax=Parasponia andersonii TaxID=3476 RepID=A0A2P5E3J8_PARAD|nr:hypothetical protein PanWU01x14_005680 [Parasponia andersonii]
MLLPNSLRHLLNRHVLSLRNQERDEQRHDQNPTRKEQEYPELEVAKHGKESLSDDESEEHVDKHRDALASRAGLKREDLARDEPTERAPRPGERRDEGAHHDHHQHGEPVAHVVRVVLEFEPQDHGDHGLGQEHLDAGFQEESSAANFVDRVDGYDGG